MYQSITFTVLTIIAVSEGCRPPPCHWNKNEAKQVEDYFSQVANVMIAADRKLQGFCNQHGGALLAKEVHKRDQYQLQYSNAGGDIYDIKVRDRVLLVLAQNCMSSVTDVRVLPAYVDGRSGSYKVDGSDLIISFQYKFDPGRGGGSCVPPDHGIVHLSQSAACNGDCGGPF